MSRNQWELAAASQRTQPAASVEPLNLRATQKQNPKAIVITARLSHGTSWGWTW